jgi:hypothetical protein
MSAHDLAFDKICAKDRRSGRGVEAADAFSVIARGSRNPQEPPRSHAMLLSYFDDSSDSKHEHYFAAGGLIGSEALWTQIYVPWAVATIALEYPFRSSDCECQKGQFSTWTKKACDQLMAKLVSIIVDLQLHGFASVVPSGEYRTVFPHSGEYDPYYLAVRHTIINMAELGHRAAQEIAFGGMECWFEDSAATSSTTTRLYQELRAVAAWPPSKSLKGLHFADKKLPQLQAADLVAREAFKHFENQGLRRTRIPMKRIGALSNFIVWRREHLEYLRDNGGPDDLELLTSWGRNPGKPKPPNFEVYWRNY